jgi:hypothetical protein
MKSVRPPPRPSDNHGLLNILLVIAEQKEDGQKIVSDRTLLVVAPPPDLAARLKQNPKLCLSVMRALFDAMAAGQHVPFPDVFFELLTQEEVASNIDRILTACNVPPSVIRETISPTALQHLLGEQDTWKFLSYDRSLAKSRSALCATIETMLLHGYITAKEILDQLGRKRVISSLPPELVIECLDTAILYGSEEKPPHAMTPEDFLTMAAPKILVECIDNDYLYDQLVEFVARRQGLSSPNDPAAKADREEIPNLAPSGIDPLASSAPPPAPAEPQPIARNSEPPVEEEIRVSDEEIDIPPARGGTPGQKVEAPQAQGEPDRHPTMRGVAPPAETGRLFPRRLRGSTGRPEDE